MAQIDYDIAMERCADFLARMIEKYGDKLLKEIEMEKAKEESTRQILIRLKSVIGYVIIIIEVNR